MCLMKKICMLNRKIVYFLILFSDLTRKTEYKHLFSGAIHRLLLSKITSSTMN